MKRLDWDSEFFGLEIGRAELAEEPLADAIAEARRSNLACLYLSVPAAASSAISEAVRAGARLVDLRMTLDGEPGAGPADGVRRATAGDEELVVRLAADLSAQSRFAADPRFRRERIADMYGIWARRSMTEGAVFVDPNEAGFAAAGRSGDEARLELVYVAASAAGQGLGERLVRAALDAVGGGRAFVVTNAANVPALRLYQRLDFRTRSLDAVLHLWLDEA